MSILITFVAILTGVLMIICVLNVSKKKQMNEMNAMIWLFGGVGVIVLGIFPDIITWVANIFNVYWDPAVLIFFLLVVIFFLLFSHSKSVSVLTGQVVELSLNLTLLKRENEELGTEVHELKTNKQFEDGT